jgi:hypothetical protein
MLFMLSCSQDGFHTIVLLATQDGFHRMATQDGFHTIDLLATETHVYTYSDK